VDSPMACSGKLAKEIKSQELEDPQRERRCFLHYSVSCKSDLGS